MTCETMVAIPWETVDVLIREGNERTPANDRALASTMAFVAGALNAAGFEAVGAFTANMTGNISAAAGRLALGDVMTGLSYAAVVGTFVAGAATSSLFVSVGRRRRVRSVHAIAVAVEGLGLAVLGGAGVVASEGVRHATLVFGLSFLLGFQNAIATRISAARVRTTHVSGMATDVGVGFGALLDLLVHRERGDEARLIRAGLRLHLGSIVSFCAGGIAGVALHRAMGSGLLICASVILLALSLPYVAGPRSRPR